MNYDELLDLVNEKDEVIGVVKRGDAHSDRSKIYRIVSITVFNNKGEVLIQKRGSRKTHPSKWENSASGHVLAGEDPAISAKRELFEELGIKSKLMYYDKWFISGKNKQKFMWMYYTLVPQGIKIKLDKDEVDEVCWLKPKDLRNFSRLNYWDLNGISHKEIIEISEFLANNKILKSNT